MANMGRSGIITRRFKAGSIVYFEGDKSEYIYILKSGRIVLSYLKPETGEEVKEEMRSGEFFGVKSALGKYPREETAQTITDTQVLVLTLADFEQLVLGNIQVVKKMLRVFSNQLRRIGKAVREVLGETDSVNPQVELFRLGEYYYNNDRFEQAMHAYKKYMEYYPDEKFASKSMERIKEIETGAPRSSSPISSDFDFIGNDEEVGVSSDESPDFTFDDSAIVSNDDDNDVVSFDDDNSLGVQSELSSEMDNFLSNDDMGDLLDEDVGSQVSALTSSLSQADDAFNQNDFNQAVNLYQKVTVMTPGNNDEQTALEKAFLGLAKGYMRLGKVKDSMNTISTFMKKYPKSVYIRDGFYQIALIFKSTGNTDKAVTYFKKVTEMMPKDNLTQNALNQISQIS